MPKIPGIDNSVWVFGYCGFYSRKSFFIAHIFNTDVSQHVWVFFDSNHCNIKIRSHLWRCKFNRSWESHYGSRNNVKIFFHFFRTKFQVKSFLSNSCHCFIFCFVSDRRIAICTFSLFCHEIYLSFYIFGRALHPKYISHAKAKTSPQRQACRNRTGNYFRVNTSNLIYVGKL